MIDSFGVRLADFNSDSPTTASQTYENFYDENKRVVQSFYIIFTFVNNKIVFELRLQVVEQFINYKEIITLKKSVG